jgi:hypothetical protein
MNMADEMELIAFEARMMKLAKNLSTLDPQKIKELIAFREQGARMRALALPDDSRAAYVCRKIQASLALLSFIAEELAKTVPTSAEIEAGGREILKRMPMPESARTFFEGELDKLHSAEVERR